MSFAGAWEAARNGWEQTVGGKVLTANGALNGHGYKRIFHNLHSPFVFPRVTLGA